MGLHGPLQGYLYLYLYLYLLVLCERENANTASEDTHVF
jgi:hypothetical protein